MRLEMIVLYSGNLVQNQSLIQLQFHRKQEEKFVSNLSNNKVQSTQTTTQTQFHSLIKQKGNSWINKNSLETQRTQMAHHTSKRQNKTNYNNQGL